VVVVVAGTVVVVTAGWVVVVELVVVELVLVVEAVDVEVVVGTVVVVIGLVVVVTSASLDPAASSLAKTEVVAVGASPFWAARRACPARLLVEENALGWPIRAAAKTKTRTMVVR
jgi:hypothetical protein